MTGGGGGWGSGKVMKKDGVCQRKRRLEKICGSIFLVGVGEGGI